MVEIPSGRETGGLSQLPKQSGKPAKWRSHRPVLGFGRKATLASIQIIACMKAQPPIALRSYILQKYSTFCDTKGIQNLHLFSPEGASVAHRTLDNESLVSTWTSRAFARRRTVPVPTRKELRRSPPQAKPMQNAQVRQVEMRPRIPANS